MAHNDWVNQSSRIVNSKAIVKAYDSFKSSFSLGPDGSGGIHFTVTSDASVDNNSSNEVARYLQISGNKDNNMYPVDFRITNERVYENTGENLIDISIKNNNSSDCILELVDSFVTSEIDIIVYKWSRPVNNSDITSNNYREYITYIGTTIQFDLIKCNMLKTYEVENGLCYDGTGELCYGIKVNEARLELTKDTPNTAVIQTSTVNGESIVSLNKDTYRQSYSSVSYIGATVSTTHEAISIKKDNIYYMRYIICPQLLRRNYSSSPTYSNWITDINVYAYIDSLSSQSQGTFNSYNAILTQKPNEYKVVSSIGKPSSDANSTISIRLIKTNDISYSYDYEIESSIRDYVVVDLTELFGKGKEPSLEWCDKNIISNNDGTFSYSKIPNAKILSRSEMCIKLENKPYMEFSLGLDSEAIGTRIGNYYIDNFEYDEESPTFSLDIKDNLNILTETTFGGISDNVNIFDSAGTHKSLNVLFNKFINRQLGYDSGLEFDFELENDVELSSISYPINVYYSELYNKFCEALQTYLVQDANNINRMYFINKYKPNAYYNIRDNQCFKISILNNLRNSIKNVVCETCIVEDGSQQETIAEKEPTPTLLDGYSIPEPNKEYDLSDSPNLFNRVLVPKLSQDGSTITGSFVISKEEYGKYHNLYVRLYAARAKFSLKYYVLALTVSPDGVPSGNNGETKNYIHFDDENGEVIVKNISDLNAGDYADFAWQTSDVSVVIAENSVTINYVINVNAVQDSIKNSEIHLINPFSSLVGQEITNEKYIGAYKAVLVGSNNNLSFSEMKYSIGNGNTHRIDDNEFIQSGCKAIPAGVNYIDAPSISNYISTSILNQFGSGVKTAEIEWVGSPYINLFDLVTLDNGITYRVHYIKHKYDGGYRQVLRLVEYKQ